MQWKGTRYNPKEANIVIDLLRSFFKKEVVWLTHNPLHRRSRRPSLASSCVYARSPLVRLSAF